MTSPDPGTRDVRGGMDTGTDAGEPGQRGPVAPGDVQAAAAEDEAPLPPDVTGSAGGGSQGDGLDPQFTEPSPS